MKTDIGQNFRTSVFSNYLCNIWFFKGQVFLKTKNNKSAWTIPPIFPDTNYGFFGYNLRNILTPLPLFDNPTKVCIFKVVLFQGCELLILFCYRLQTWHKGGYNVVLRLGGKDEVPWQLCGCSFLGVKGRGFFPFPGWWCRVGPGVAAIVAPPLVWNKTGWKYGFLSIYQYFTLGKS